MTPQQLASEILQFTNSLHGYWDKVKIAIVDILAVPAHRAMELGFDLFKSKEVFFEVITHIILITKKTPSFFYGFFKVVLMFVFNKIIIPVMDKKFGDGWMGTIRKRTQYVKVVNGEATFIA